MVNMRHIQREYRRSVADRFHPHLPLSSKVEVWNEEFLELSKGLRAARQNHLDEVNALISRVGGDAFDKHVTEDGDAAQMKEELEGDLNSENAPDVWNGFGASTCLNHCFAGMLRHPRYKVFFGKMDVLQGLIPDGCEASHEGRTITIPSAGPVEFFGFIKECARCAGCNRHVEEYSYECRRCKKMIDVPSRCEDCAARDGIKYVCEPCRKKGE